MSRLPITAFIASHNEAHLLPACLNPLSFCQEIVIIDLESEDKTAEVAKTLGATIVRHERIPYLEILEPKLQEMCNTEWMLLIDPDEVMQSDCVEFMLSEFPKLQENQSIGAINFPWLFYFKSHHLKGTHWGGISAKTLLMRKSAIEFTGRVHSGIKLKPTFENFSVSYEKDRFIAHYWMTSYRALIKKHIRYFKGTGEFLYKNGERTTFLKVLLSPFVGGFESYFLKKGYKDGLIGLFLGFFYSWLNTGFQITLYRYQKRQRSEKILNNGLMKLSKINMKNYIKSQLKMFIQEEMKRQLRTSDAINQVRQNAIRIRNLDYLYEAMKWSKKPDFDRVAFEGCNDPMEVNGQKLKDMEVILGACANIKDPKGTILEIGTAYGGTTMRMSQVCPTASIVTINIPEEEIVDGGNYVTFALPNNEIGINYRDAGCTNITQILANTLHWEPEMEFIDVAFVDGCHDADFVYQDTKKVLSKCRPGSIILWHDFNPDLVDKWGWIMDVCRGIDRLYAEGFLTKKMYYLEDSWVGIYQV